MLRREYGASFRLPRGRARRAGGNRPPRQRLRASARCFPPVSPGGWYAVSTRPGRVRISRRQAHDIAGDRFARRGRDEVKPRARPADPPLDDVDKAAYAALRILLGKPGNIGVDGLRDLLVDQVLHVPADSAEDKPGADRGNRQIGERYLEYGGAKELTYGHRVSCIRRRVSSGAAEGRSLCRSWRAAAKYGRQ